MATEHFSTRYHDLDTWPSLDILSAFYEGQLSAVAAVRPSLPAIAAAAEEAVGRLRRGGRLVYAGAGTSGRIGVQDGTELPPTFNWPDERVVYLIAGGTGAIMQAVENAEDSVEDGIAGIRNNNVGPNDVVIGVAASGTHALHHRGAQGGRLPRGARPSASPTIPMRRSSKPARTRFSPIPARR